MTLSMSFHDTPEDVEELEYAVVAMFDTAMNALS
jgi:hypothetical protein